MVASATELRFRIIDRFRPFDLIAPGFVQHDTFDDEVVLPNGVERVIDTTASLVAPFGSVVSHVEHQQRDGEILAGVALRDGARVLARYSRTRARLTIEAELDGQVSVLARAPVSLPDRFGFAVVVNGNRITALTDDESEYGWRPLLVSSTESLLDLRRPERIRGCRLVYGGSGTRLARARAGYFGQVGLRDPQLVRDDAGEPIIRNGRMHFTIGSAGMGFSQEAHWGVWAFDPTAPREIEQVSKLFFEHDGIVTGDNAGQIVFDRNRQRFVILVCGGNLPEPGVYVRYCETAADVLSGVHVLPNERLDTEVDLSSWEPSLAKIDGRWHVAYANVVELGPELRFHPVLATAKSGDGLELGLETRSADTTVGRTEGCVLQRFADTWQLLATDDEARRYRVYDLDLKELGVLDAPFLQGGPHPMLFPSTRDSDGEWMMLTFANRQYAEEVLGYGTEGDLVVMRGEPNGAFT